MNVIEYDYNIGGGLGRSIHVRYIYDSKNNDIEIINAEYRHHNNGRVYPVDLDLIFARNPKARQEIGDMILREEV